MNIKRIISFFFAIVVLILSGCGDIMDDAKEALATIEKAEAQEEEGDCAYYKTKYENTGDETWAELYDKECKEDFVEANKPKDLSEDCEVQYKELAFYADSIARSLRDQCTPETAETTPVCQDARVDVEQKAQAFSKECTVTEFYYADVTEYSQKTITGDDGECYWTAWIPPETRLEGQTEIEKIDVRCVDESPKCMDKSIQNKVIRVEEYFDANGKPVYLPCAEQMMYYDQGAGPCDFNADGVVSMGEREKCKQEEIENPCDFNRDGVVDEWEKGECTFYGDNGFVDGSKLDPCDFNADGKVEMWEKEQCQNGFGCKIGEVPFWDYGMQKEVCVPERSVPVCPAPQWPELINGGFKCIAPCDWNRDGIVDEYEKSECNYVSCKEGELMFWDAAQGKDVCVSKTNVPQCNMEEYPEFVNGKVICVQMCDWNKDGIVDDFESSQCAVTSCPPGEKTFWDDAQMQEVCVADAAMPECAYPGMAEFVDGEVRCIKPCDWNKDGIIDQEESNSCGTYYTEK
jgi:hypothetical protein